MRVTVSIPDPLFNAAERLAKAHALSRSQLYTEALQAYLSSSDSAAVTEQLDAVYSNRSGRLDGDLHRAQLEALDDTW